MVHWTWKDKDLRWREYISIRGKNHIKSVSIGNRMGHILEVQEERLQIFLSFMTPFSVFRFTLWLTCIASPVLYMFPRRPFSVFWDRISFTSDFVWLTIFFIAFLCVCFCLLVIFPFTQVRARTAIAPVSARKQNSGDRVTDHSLDWGSPGMWNFHC